MKKIGSAIGLIYLDNQIQYSPKGIFKYLLPASVDSTRSILVIIAGGILFSVLKKITRLDKKNK